MEFLLANHPLDCPICDQGGECDLQVNENYRACLATDVAIDWTSPCALHLLASAQCNLTQSLRKEAAEQRQRGASSSVLSTPTITSPRLQSLICCCQCSKLTR